MSTLPPPLLLGYPRLRPEVPGIGGSLGGEEGSANLPGTGLPLPTQLSSQPAEAALPRVLPVFTPACLWGALQEGRAARPWCGKQTPWSLGSQEGDGGCLSRVTRGNGEGQGPWTSGWGSAPGTLCWKEAVTNIPSTSLLPQHLSFPSRHLTF